MQPADTRALTTLATTLATVWPKATEPSSPGMPPPAPRLFSIWEITTWILPMAAEHLRRVLRQHPDLPQGQSQTGSESDSANSTRWFAATDVATLRHHFAAIQDRTAGAGSRKTYAPRRPAGARAPLIALTAPLGRAGRSTATLHLAVAAALAGYKVLVIDADPAGQLAGQLGAASDGGTLLPLIARSCGLHLRQINAGRLDRGEPPLPMDDTLAIALETDPSSLIRPSRWPGLDVIAADPALALADMQIAGWSRALRNWPVAQALARTLAETPDNSDLRRRYDLILCDMGAGLGPLAMAILTSADVLLLPLRAGAGQDPGTGTGLAPLAQAMAALDAEATMTARATGQPAPPLHWRRVCLLPVGGPLPSMSAPPLAAAGLTLLPHPLPDLPPLATAAHLYDLDYRHIGRLPYTPLRDACDAAWTGLAAVLADLWAEDSVHFKA